MYQPRCQTIWARRFWVFLTGEQDKTLLNLRTADVPQKVKDRAEVIRLNAHGWYVEKD